jgi:alginate O-acetyltransferase complex protein AlgI
MLFQTLSFFLLLTLACSVYWALPRLRLWILALANAVFYLVAGWANLGLFLAASWLTYVIGGRVTGRQGKAWLALGIALNIANLAWFKYAGFAANVLQGWFPWVDPGWVKTVLLPIGISFYTFQHISYLVDRRLKDLPAAPNYLHFWVYISFFGHSIAGPIMRGDELFPQIARATSFEWDGPRWRLGLGLFLLGLFKKVAIATPLAAVVDWRFETPTALTMGEAWVAAALFAFQIYYDFSAYSDMAVGIGHMFGLTLTQNFRTPYVSAGASEFWQRWHVTLSAWIRDYVYIPLGGKRASPSRVRLNLFLAMLISGLWHGANWTFVAWGAYHGVLLLAQRAWWTLKTRLAWSVFASATYRTVATGTFFVLVTLGWVFFRCHDVGDALAMIVTMCRLDQLATFVSVKKLLLLVIGLYGLHWLEYLARRDEAAIGRWWVVRVPVTLQGLAYAAFMLYFLAGYDITQAFIYFRF